MKIKSAISKKWLSGGIGALLTAYAGFALVALQLGKKEGEGVIGQGLINLSYDIPFAWRQNIPVDNVLVIYIDEESYSVLDKNPLQPWDRQLHADLVNRLTQGGAALIVMDIVFIGNTDPEATDNLVAAIKNHGNVVIGADYQISETLGKKVERVYYPDFEFQQVSTNGLVSLWPDPDYCVREQFHADPSKPSLAWVAARQFLRQKGEPEIRNYNQPRWLNYYGPPGHIPHISYHMAVSPDGIPVSQFKDKVVFIGLAPTLTGNGGELREQYVSPFTRITGEFVGGVAVHATAFLNLIRGDWLRRLPPPVETLILIFTGCFLGFFLCLFRPLPAVIVALPCAALVTGVHFLAFSQLNYWFPWLIVVGAQIPVALSWSVLSNTIKLQIEKKTLQHSLELHLSPPRARQILRRPDLLKPGAEKQEITILFTDIANFSKITGRMDPGDLFELLNNYFEAALGCIHQNDGTVIKLIGDAIFAIWNAPFPQKNHEALACKAAWMLRNSLMEFDIRNQSLPMRTRIGLHTGEAYIGNVGSTARFDYTAIGDNINLASRLEGLNKHIGTDILVTRDTQKKVADEVISRLIGHFRFKGFDRIVEVHELNALKEKNTTRPDWLDSFEKGLFHFQRRAFDRAEEAFHKTIESRGDDGPSRFYLGKIVKLRVTPPPPDWTGEIDVTEK